MTDIEMLPMPSVLLNWPHPTNHVAIRDYARAVAEYNVAARDAEIEALRAEREVIVAEAVKYADKSGRLEAKAERLAEALHKLEDACDDSDGAQYGTLGTSFVRGICKDALLRDHDQEGKDG